MYCNRLFFIYLLIVSGCSNIESSNRSSYGHPFDSINTAFAYDTKNWKVELIDSSSNLYDSIMFYDNDSIAKIIGYDSNLGRMKIDLFDSINGWSSQMFYEEGIITMGIKVSYNETGLIKYNYHLLEGRPIGSYTEYYDHHHDSVLLGGYVYPRSTHLKEYRLYDILGNLRFNQKYTEDQLVMFDSGHSVIPITNEDVHNVNKPMTTIIWVASPHELEQQIIIRNNQTLERDTIQSLHSEVAYTFTPKVPGMFRFTIFHNLIDTMRRELRIDSVTYRIHVTE